MYVARSPASLLFLREPPSSLAMGNPPAGVCYSTPLRNTEHGDGRAVAKFDYNAEDAEFRDDFGCFFRKVLSCG